MTILYRLGVSTCRRLIFSYTFLILTVSINASSVVTSISAQQPSTYRLVSSSSSYAQYLPWHPCLNGTLIFEFRTAEPNGLLMYAQSLPYKYIQLSLVDGLLRLRMRIGEKDNPRGIFLVYQTKKLSDNKWHEVQLLRMNERTVLVVDGESLHHVHKEASLDGTDLYFGDSSAYYDMMLMLNGNGGGGGASTGQGGATTSTSFASIFFIGGLPSTIQTFDLSLGTALFEPRFSGQFRNVRALNCSSPYLMRLQVIASSGLQYGPVDQDSCMSSPCLNNGVCSILDGDETGGSFHQSTHQLYYSYQSGQQYDDYEQQARQGFECDCTFTNYEGRLCEKLKPPQTKAELTFSGKEFFSFDLPGSSTAVNHPTYEEEYFMEFKTSRSTGLLAYSGDSQDYFVFGLLDGGLYFKLNMRGQLFERTLAIPGTFLHNNLWHSVKFTRRLKQIEIMVDNVKKESSGFTGDFIATQTRTIYIGGVPKQNIIYRTIRKNFIGCLRNVTFKTDVSTTPLNLVEMALNNSVLVTKHGSIETSCRKLMDPITFSSPNTYIPVYTWKDYPKLYSFSIEFQTTENYGLLAYILGPEQPKKHYKRQQQHSSQSSRSLTRDFFALEIHNRFLNAYFNLGGSSTYIRHEVVHEHVSSGKSHQVHVELNDKYAVFRFDQKPETSIRLDTSPFNNETLELSGPLVIGGLYPNHTTGSDPFASPSQKIPPYFYSGMLGGHGYVGCIQDVEINGQYVNLTKYAAQEGVSGVNTDVCTPMPNQCDIGHCMNDGVCMEGWNRFYCDCSATGFNGPICNQPATTAHFASGQHIRIQFEPEWNSEAEHLSLRFRTEKKHNSILLSTYSSYTRDYVEISLDETRVKLSLKIGTNDITMYSEDDLCDNEWHTLKVMREGPRIILQVDNDVPSTGMLGELNSTRDVQLKFSYLEIGASLYTDREYFLDPETSHVLSYSTIDMGSKFSKHKNSPYTQRNLNSFQGEMQQLVINGRSYFELIANDDLSSMVNKTVDFSRLDLPHKYPISFNNHQSGFELPKIDSSHILLIQFHFKTTDESGLILFNKGHGSDFLAVELHQGQIHYVFGVGAHSGEPMRIRSRARNKLNDNKWHLVSIWRSTRANHELTVDSLVYKYTSEQKDGGGAFKLVDKLFVGGLKNQSIYNELSVKKMIASKNGFKGCLASIEINGHMPDLEYILNSKTKSHGNVSKGCENAYDCTPDACKHGGVCVEKWDENRRVCNCEFTTYTGKFCEKRSKGYSINKGSILFNYKSPFYWQDDTLTFGFETKNVDALLFRAFSYRVNKTLQIELIDGHLQAIFTDLHGITHFHQFKNYRLNKNRYHIVKFRVSDFNSSLQVDGINARKDPHSDHTLKIVRKHPPMPKNNDGSLITVELTGSRDFVGKIYGLVYNQHRILDLLAENDRRMSTSGELDLIEESNTNEILISSCNDPTSPNYHKEECKQYQSSSTTRSPVNESSRLTKTSQTSTLPTPITQDRPPATTTRIDHSSSSSSSPESVTSVNTETSVSGENGLTSEERPNYLEKLLQMSTGYLVAFAAGGVFLFFLIVLALYKFFTREEGSYRIDESKNCGPFADLDVPLNGATSGTHGTNSKKKRDQLVKANKEWFV